MGILNSGISIFFCKISKYLCWYAVLPSGGLLVGRHGLQSGSLTIHGTLNPLAQWLEVSFGGCVIARSLSNVSFCLCNPTKVGSICFCFFHRRLALHDDDN